MPSAFKLTKTERKDLRGYFAEEGYSHVTIWDNQDGTHAVEVCGMVFDGESPSAVLRELAEVLEEQ